MILKTNTNYFAKENNGNENNRQKKIQIFHQFGRIFIKAQGSQPKDVTVTITRNQLVVVTGVSGLGNLP
jgi:excinuclease UvrABC ATPase subunit